MGLMYTAIIVALPQWDGHFGGGVHGRIAYSARQKSIWADQSSTYGYCPAMAYGPHPSCWFVREAFHHTVEEVALIEVLACAPLNLRRCGLPYPLTATT